MGDSRRVTLSLGEIYTGWVPKKKEPPVSLMDSSSTSPEAMPQSSGNRAQSEAELTDYKLQNSFFKQAVKYIPPLLLLFYRNKPLPRELQVH